MPAYLGTNAWSRSTDKGQRVMELQKAMATQQLGTLGFAPGPGQIGVQSLEGQLYVLTFGDSEFKLLQDLHKVPAFNWVHEFNVLSFYGGSVGAFVGAAALPPINNSYFKRGFAEIKFAFDVRMIPQQMLEIESAVGNYVGVETRNSLMMLLSKVNHALYWGNSGLNQFSIDGVYAQVSANFPGNILDLRGNILDPGTLENAALLIRQNWGDVGLNRLYASPAVITPFTVNYVATQRSVPVLWTGGAGNPFSYWDSQFGRIMLRDDRFAERDPFNGPSPITTMVSVPQGLVPTPTAAPTVGTIANDSASQFNTQTPGGWFAYCFAYVNPVGVGMVSPMTSAVLVQNGQSVPLTFPTAGVNPVPSAIRIYRQFLAPASTPAGNVPAPSYSGMQFMTEIPAVISTSGTSFTDENADIPGTYTAFLVNTSKDGAHIAKLGDARKWELAPVNMAYWFASSYYYTLVMPAQQWTVCIKNIGSTQVGTPVNAAYQG